MGGLWGDGYFYLAAAGFLISFVLFLFLLGQYRAAVEGADESAETVPPSPGPVPIPSVPVVSSVVAPAEEKTLVLERKPAEAPAEVKTPAYTGPERRRADTTTGQLSPAVVYLQNIKGQLEKFDQDIANLKQLASQQAAQGEAIMQRLAALADVLQDLKATPAPAPAPAPAELSAAQGFTLPETPAPAAEADKTLVIERSSVPPPAPAAEPKAEPPQPTSPLELKLDTPAQPLPQAPEPEAKPRKGPVWPV